MMSLGLNGPLFYELREVLRRDHLLGADLFGAEQGMGVVGDQPPAGRPRCRQRGRLAKQRSLHRLASDGPCLRDWRYA